MTDPLSTAKDGVALVGELIKAAGDNPAVKEAGNNLGQTALTITKTINNALLPLAAVNFAFDKARAYFSDKFESDLRPRADRIPPEQLVEPKASIAGPALQGLAFSHDEPSLKDMYLSLIASAMDGRTAADVHPAFVEIIRQLTPEEASSLQSILTLSNSIPIAAIKKTTVGEHGWSTVSRHLLNGVDMATRLPVDNPRIPAMVDNWIRLGLVEVNYTQFLVGENAYNWVSERPEYLRLKAQYETDKVKIEFTKGILYRTALGQQFAQTVGLEAARSMPPGGQ